LKWLESSLISSIGITQGALQSFAIQAGLPHDIC
jgi:hypothetical protein